MTPAAISSPSDPSGSGKRPKADVADLEARTAQLMTAFEAHLRDERGLAMRTVLFYTSDTRGFAAWLRVQKPPRFLGQPDTISYLLVRRYLSDCSRQSDTRTVRRRITSLRAFWRWLLQSGQTTREPLVAIELPIASRPSTSTPSARTVAKFLESIPVLLDDPIALRDRALLEALYASGATAGEMATLSLEDWDRRGGTLKVGSGTRQERTVPIGREAERAMQRYVERGRGVLLSRRREPKAAYSTLWFSERGLPLSTVLMYQMVRRRAGEAGIARMSPHILRRACAVHLLRAGASPYAVMSLLGCRAPMALDSYVNEANMPEVEESQPQDGDKQQVKTAVKEFKGKPQSKIVESESRAKRKIRVVGNEGASHTS